MRRESTLADETRARQRWRAVGSRVRSATHSPELASSSDPSSATDLTGSTACGAQVAGIGRRPGDGRPATEKTRILVVDDEPAIIRAITSLLGTCRCESTSASSVDDALSLLGERSFDLVLSDINMPQRSGFDLLEAVRSSWPQTAVILMSARTTPETKYRALKAGAVSFLPKPFSSGMLLDAIDGLPHALP
jgi:CheY-like chemotaxis protein